MRKGLGITCWVQDLCMHLGQAFAWLIALLLHEVAQPLGHLCHVILAWDLHVTPQSGGEHTLTGAILEAMCTFWLQARCWHVWKSASLHIGAAICQTGTLLTHLAET